MDPLSINEGFMLFPFYFLLPTCLHDILTPDKPIFTVDDLYVRNCLVSFTNFQKREEIEISNSLIYFCLKTL